ncbi:MAG: hypothetical protein AABZ10_16260, partial [Nitrospirota bacterium]
YRDADTGSGLTRDTELKFFAEEAGSWVVIGIGAGHEPLCSGGPLFSVLPVSADAISRPSLLGEFNPPGHTVPNDHTGIYVNTTGVQLVSPGNLHITGLVRSRFLVSPWRQGESDYTIDYAACATISGRFGHVTTLVDGLAAQLNGGSCSTYNTADEEIEYCTFPVDIPVSAGDALGTVGGPTAGAFDFGLYDDSRQNYYINPSRVHNRTLHAVCPYDYFEPLLKEYLLSRVVRTGEPRCGTMEIDVDGTAQGLWVLESDPVQQRGDESFFVSLALDTVLPLTKQVLSVGPASLGPGLMKVGTQHTGRVNRAFSEVRPDNTIYCYTTGLPYPPYSYFVSLGNDGRLSIEKVAGSSPCLNDPATWVFGVNRVMFIR